MTGHILTWVYIYIHILYIYMNLPVKRGVYAFNLQKRLRFFQPRRSWDVAMAWRVASCWLLPWCICCPMHRRSGAFGLRYVDNRSCGGWGFGVYCFFLVLWFEVWGDFCYVSKFFVNIFWWWWWWWWGGGGGGGGGRSFPADSWFFQHFELKRRSDTLAASS